MKNDWVLVVAENEVVEAEDTDLLVRAGFPASGIRSAKGEDALEFIKSRLLPARYKERPGLIIFDLDHHDKGGRKRLKELMMTLKGSEYRSLPLVMLLRPDFDQQEVREWYREGVNAVVLRPNDSGDDALELFRSICVFWRDRALLPDPSWDRNQTGY